MHDTICLVGDSSVAYVPNNFIIMYVVGLYSVSNMVCMSFVFWFWLYFTSFMLGIIFC